MRPWATLVISLVALLIAVTAFVVVFGHIAGRWANRRERSRVAQLLPTDAPVVGLLTGETPALTGADMRRAFLLYLVPGFVLGPFGVVFLIWLLKRGRAGRVVAFTSDGRTWLLETSKRSIKPSRVLGSQPSTEWRTHRNLFRRYAEVAGEDLSFNRLGQWGRLPEP